MRTRMITVALACVLLLLTAAVLMAGDEEKVEGVKEKGEKVKAEAVKAEGAKWLDPAGCYYCQPLMETEGMLEHCTWESHKIENGVLDVTTVEPGWEEAYEKAHQEMTDRWNAFDPANPQKMCGMCQAFVAAWDESIQMQDIKTMHGHVMLTTSPKPEVVKKLHMIADRTTKEMKKMAAEAHAH